MSTTLAKLQTENRVKAEPATKAELDQLREVVKRNLADAKAADVSPDGRFGFSYSAARTLATMVIRAAGYRVTSKMGGHYYTFLALEASDAAFDTQAAAFDDAREKRNDFSDEDAGVVTDSEAEALLNEVTQFQQDAEAWIAKKDPSLA
jgi:hypothetical protein